MSLNVRLSNKFLYRLVLAFASIPAKFPNNHLCNGPSKVVVSRQVYQSYFCRYTAKSLAYLYQPRLYTFSHRNPD